MTTTQERIYKTFKTEVKVLDESQGIVTAFVNTMGRKDADGEIINPTAFNNSIRDNLPIPVLAGHDQSKIVGKVLTAYPMSIDEEEYRLHATMQMNLETEAGRDAFSNVKGNYVKEWSVGFNIPEDGVVMERDGNELTRVINNLDWVETSSVIRGASPDTGTLSAKSIERGCDCECTCGKSIKEQNEPEEKVASDAVEETASDTTQESLVQVARTRINLLKTRLDLGRKKPKKPRY